jgi:hypothetical protein
MQFNLKISKYEIWKLGIGYDSKDGLPGWAMS